MLMQLCFKANLSIDCIFFSRQICIPSHMSKLWSLCLQLFKVYCGQRRCTEGAIMIKNKALCNTLGSGLTVAFVFCYGCKSQIYSVGLFLVKLIVWAYFMCVESGA
jgi:hypothetical protein